MKQYAQLVSGIGVAMSFIVIFVDIPPQYKNQIGIVFFVLLLGLYIALWLYANNLIHKNLSINNSTLEVKVGDLFREQDFKVIAFNEYFDTLVDDEVIASRTLNGYFLTNKVDNIGELDVALEKDFHLNDRIVEHNDCRLKGKKTKYLLGTIYVHKNEYLLTAFTHFDNDNKAYLTMPDYLKFLINFWSEIDRVYAGHSVAIPLMGSGITRFRGYDMIEDQELLQILIWTFKVSRIKFTYPAKVTIIIHPDKKDKINFYELR